METKETTPQKPPEEREHSAEREHVDGSPTNGAAMQPARETKPWKKAAAVVAVLILAIAAFAYRRLAQQFEDTDDAQIDADIIHVSARVPGTVTAVHVVDNQEVKAGEVLIELDPNDLKVGLA